MERLWRFKFGIRTIFAITTVGCVMLVGWNWATATQLWVERNVPPTEHINTGYGGKAMIVHGRFFGLNGPAIAIIRLEAFPRAHVGESPQFRYFKSHGQAERRWPGFYTFSIQVPAIGPRDRCDIGIKTATGATQQISVGDLSLLPTRVTVEEFGSDDENMTDEETE